METNFEKYRKRKRDGEHKPLADDILQFDGEEYKKVKEPMEIVQLTGIITDEEQIKKLEEDFVVQGGDFSGKEVKRGDYIWISCLMKKPGTSYAPQSIGVLKTRVTDVFLGLSKLNQIMK